MENEIRTRYLKEGLLYDLTSEFGEKIGEISAAAAASPELAFPIGKENGQAVLRLSEVKTWWHANSNLINKWFQ
jgi:hypothetical protein